MEYTCQHCNSNLDKGDIFEHFMSKYKNSKDALKRASMYGWSETNKIHFNRSIIVQSEDSHTICPDCKKKDPFKMGGS